jgi:hypothetical protein
VSELNLKILNVMREKHKVVRQSKASIQKNLTLLQKKKIDDITLNEA